VKEDKAVVATADVVHIAAIEDVEALILIEVAEVMTEVAAETEEGAVAFEAGAVQESRAGLYRFSRLIFSIESFLACLCRISPLRWMLGSRTLRRTR
jgi:hypothetical protein